MSENSATVVAAGLSKCFNTPQGGSLYAVYKVSMTLETKLTALVGPDGAGKTTLLRMIAGLLKPDAGELRVLGLDVASEPQKVQSRISYMPQRFGLYEDLTVQENLDLYADLHGVPERERHERFARMLEMTDMARFSKRPAGKLSGGMKQKLGLACTLVRSPDLLLLDEPSAGVDPLSRRDLWKIIQQLVEEENLNVIVSTAYMDEAERCAQVYVMHEGQQLAAGTPDALKQQAHGLTFIASPPSGSPARELQAQLMDAQTLIVDAVPRAGAVSFITQNGAPESELKTLLGQTIPQPRPAQLEDAFMMMLHQQRGENTEVTPDPLLSPPPANLGGVAITVSNLVRKFGEFTAVASTSFEVFRGEIFGLLGPNGAGKTTTFRMLCGLLPATSGKLEVAGINLRTARAMARGRIGYVSQKFSLYGSLTVQENLSFFGGAYGLRGRLLQERVSAVIEQFGLEAQAISGLLPGGFKQRLAMAAGLLHDPDILFLDEPTSGIDPLARRAFWRTITALAHRGVTVVITTHFMEEAEYCDRIAIQDAGKLLALGTPQQVRAMAGGEPCADMNSAFIAIVEQGRAKNGLGLSGGLK